MFNIFKIFKREDYLIQSGGYYITELNNKRDRDYKAHVCAARNQRLLCAVAMCIEGQDVLREA